ncbi:hypothetical protein [Spirosoma radiotolerans]|uniref:Uncharacterized protein n=1 Tax=Spirosoma radiotolerans TaxID=1379870 RepID=A0A0E3V707_9BACT|nr:hypothetical protein [Spirosoma radiotolerans]AKD55006.1 hypothetical protein SD10_08920 [Spirosoma radiotolerans]
MSEKDLALAVLAVNQLPFVDNVNVPLQAPTVFIKLSPKLAEVLPEARSVLQVEKTDFSVAEVIRVYNLYVVEYLDEIADLSHQLLMEAMDQIIKKARS